MLTLTSRKISAPGGGGCVSSRALEAAAWAEGAGAAQRRSSRALIFAGGVPSRGRAVPSPSTSLGAGSPADLGSARVCQPGQGPIPGVSEGLRACPAIPQPALGMFWGQEMPRGVLSPPWVWQKEARQGQLDGEEARFYTVSLGWEKRPQLPSVSFCCTPTFYPPKKKSFPWRKVCLTPRHPRGGRGP